MLTATASRVSAIDQVIRWWQGHRREQSLPKRNLFGSADLGGALPDIFLLDTEVDRASGKRLYRCELTGTEIDYMLGVNLITPYTPDFPLPFEIQAITEECNKAVLARKPIRGDRCIERPHDRHFEYEWVVAPLADEAGTDIVGLIGAIEFKCIFDLPCGRPPGCPGRELCQNMALRDLPAGCGLKI